MRSLAPAALAFVLLASAYPAAAGAQPAPSPEPAPATAAPTAPPAPPVAAPLPSPPPPASPAPSPAPSPAVSPSPTPAVSPGSPYHYVVTPPTPAPGMPVILEIDMLDETIHAGAPYSVRVKTSLDVATISVSAMGSTYGMQAAGPGLFASDGQVPGGIPFFLLNRSYGITVIAQTADKRTTTVTLNLRLER